MSGTAATISELTRPAAAGPPRPAALPYLSVADARAAIDWYTNAFDAVVIGEPIVMADGRIGHAEIAIGDGVLYLADEYPEYGLKAPAPQAVSVSLMLHVVDADATLQKARDHGAVVEREPYENHGNLTATIVDPFGHRWLLSGPAGMPVAGIRHGAIGYVSVWTPDVERAAAFYGRVLGWVYDSASQQITNSELPTGISASAASPTLFCCYAVADVPTARGDRRSRWCAGGRASHRLRRCAGCHRPARRGVRGIRAAGQAKPPGAQWIRARGFVLRDLSGAGFRGLPRFLRPGAGLDLRARQGS